VYNFGIKPPPRRKRTAIRRMSSPPRIAPTAACPLALPSARNPAPSLWKSVSAPSPCSQFPARAPARCARCKSLV